MIPPPPNQVFSAFSFVGFVMCAIPFYWHMEAWNTGTCLYMAWTGLGCLNYFINSIVWNGTVLNKAPVWCDISTRFIIGLNVAVPAASLCINRRLYKISTVKAVMVTRSEKRRAVMTDLAIGLGIPIIQMALQYVVSGHRFDIYEDFGPYYFTWNTVPAYPLSVAWPLAIGLVSFVYCALTIRQFWKRGRQFNQMLSSNRGLNQSRYLRLMCLSLVEVLGTIPITTYSIWFNAKDGQVNKWVSWANTHYNYSKVEQIPSVLWKSDYNATVSLELSRWFCVLCAFVFFGFFGFADEARKHYRLVYTSLSSRLGYSTTSSSLTASSNNFNSSFPDMSSKGNVTLPVFVSNNGRGKADSMLSFSDKLSTSISIGDFADDFKADPYSPTESSSSASSSHTSEEDLHRERASPEPTVPASAVTRPQPPPEISVAEPVASAHSVNVV
ncbi:STE3-domain-containing protein [Artomyces pyxidatus]|uniref:STE3-domain-containing protein n=1 Tax=Artomyces pyxidatus TaxID=48021 RepID=A0ACB8SWK8_9AGAM|nr:STE3-domain-containing protein [Artomyces pyxidatus]